MKHLELTAIKNGYKDFNINNYDSSKFHIDHVVPCAAFRLECSYHQKLCFHWTNLQILERIKNQKKNDSCNL